MKEKRVELVFPETKHFWRKPTVSKVTQPEVKSSWDNVQDGLSQSEMPFLSSVSYTLVGLN